MRRAWITILSWLRSIFIKNDASGIVEVESNGSYSTIDVLTLQKMVQKRPDTFLLVNVHIPYDGDIPGTDLSVPYNQIHANLDKFPIDKHAEIVLYCMKDVTSRIAAKSMVKAGYDNIKILIGGFVAWQDAGFPLIMNE